MTIYSSYSEEINPPVESTPSEVVEGVMESPSSVVPESSATPEQPLELTSPDPTSTETPPSTNETIGMEIPQISAKTYDLKIIRPSLSKNMYLFSKESDELPEIGRIILLKNGMTPVMGFRVIKVYSDKKQIAAKKIKTYPGFENLEKDSTYRAFEKLGDVSQIPNTASDITDLNELEGGSAPLETPAVPTEKFPALDQNEEEIVSQNLDQGLSNDQNNDQGNDQSNGENFGESEQDLDPDKNLSGYYKNIFEFDFGSFHGTNLPGGSSTNGLGISYTKLLSDKPKGAIAAEFGLGYYKSSGDVSVVDSETDETTLVSQSFTVTPVTMRLRYHFNFSDEWSYYLYGGMIYNRIASQFGATEEEVSLAQKVIPGLGAGVYIPTGPGWYMRVNLGIDFLGIGVALRF